MPRPKGSLNKPKPLQSLEHCPKVFLQRVMNDQLAPMNDRIDCAKALLPYMHKKMPVDNNVDLILPDNVTVMIGHHASHP